MNEPRPYTFRLRLEEMQRDLVAITNELNKSHEWDAGLRAQQILIAIDHLFGADVDLDEPVDWRWPPEVLPYEEPG